MSTAEVPTVAAVILAAGEGSRFRGRRHKLLAEIDGQPIVAMAVAAALAAGFDETIVVQGAVDLREVLGDEVTLLHNESWAAGQATSLRVAIDYAAHRRHGAVIVGLGDQPLLDATTWRRVADVEAPIVAATYDGARRPPTRLSSDVWPLLPIGGDEGARDLMRRRPELVTEVACEGAPADIDTVEDLEKWS